jgi:hypothetical protein
MTILFPEQQHRLTTQSDKGVISTANIYVADKKIVALPQHLYYTFRVPDLSILILFENVALIDVFPKYLGKPPTEKPEAETGHRRSCLQRRIQFFASAYEHNPYTVNKEKTIFIITKKQFTFKTRVQSIRSKPKIPVLIGPPPQPNTPKPAERTPA